MPRKARPITTAERRPARDPRMPGSASGLRVTACKVAPGERERRADAAIASTVRGRRAHDGAPGRPRRCRRRGRRGRRRATSTRSPNATEATHEQQRARRCRPGEQPRQADGRRTPAACQRRRGAPVRTSSWTGSSSAGAQSSARGEQREVLVDAPADRRAATGSPRRRAAWTPRGRRCGPRRSRGSATAADRPAAAAMKAAASSP